MMGLYLLLLIVVMAAAALAIFALASPSQGQWRISENGNPTRLIGGKRITIFPSHDGWKYCIAADRPNSRPNYSDPYRTSEEAEYEALAFIDGRPSRYRTIKEQEREEYFERRRKERLEDLETEIQKREQVIADILRLLAPEDLNVTTLRKPQARIATQLRSLRGDAIASYRDAGVKEALVVQAEKQKIALEEMAQRVETRIAERKAKRKSPMKRQ